MNDRIRPAGRADDPVAPAGDDGVGNTPVSRDAPRALADDRPAEELPEGPALDPRAFPQPWIVVGLVLLALLIGTLLWAVLQGAGAR